MRWVPLTRGYFARVDDADYAMLQQHTWYAVVTPKGNYAQTRIDGRAIRMHVLLMGTKGVDHRDGDGLNNVRANLRFATARQNAQNRRVDGKNNTTGFKGVIRRPDRPGKFRARIVVYGRTHYLGDYNTAEAAAHAYDAAAKEHFGEFARLNFPDGSQSGA